ncbi:MAG: hypothetical protein PSW75_02925 [bacterium]|nr:hypothetical protein [bacterium]MDI1336038.1 hypothetical protein [Lacunisphaera sp.]
MHLLNLILALGTVLAAVAVSLIGLLGLVVWLAGGRWAQRE